MFILLSASEEEVLHLTGNLSGGKAINENDIPTKVVKLSNLVLAPILRCMFNQ